MHIVGTETVFEKQNVIALGTFDGLHRAHSEIVHMVRELAVQHDMGSMVYTFATLPSARFGGESQVLFTPEEKAQIFCEEGIDYLQMQPFDEKIACQSREDFMDYLIETLRGGILVAGFDFRFGAGAKGDAAFLQQYAEAHGAKAIILAQVDDGGEAISSTRIRAAVRQGDMELAQRLLGRPYFITGEVCHGREVGRTIGFPTANIYAPACKVMPPRGVYITRIWVDGQAYGGVTNIGNRPTLNNGEDVSIETNILDFSGNIYGKQVKVELLHFVRGERSFENIDALQQEIARNKQTAHDFFADEK